MPNTLISTAAKSAASPESAVTRAVDQLPAIETNVSDIERWIALVAGGLLVTRGFTGRGPGLLSALAGGYLLYRAATGNCPGYQMLGISTAGPSGPNAAIPAGHGVRVEHAITVNQPVNVVYRFWRGFENLPRFMPHLESVETTGDNRSHWVARGPLGLRVEWDAEIVTDTPNEVISWRSLDGSDVDTAGSVHFREAGQGSTEVRVNLKYNPPGGKVGSAASRLLGQAPEQQIREDLQRFKEMIEAVRVVTPAGNSSGQP
jgi:uncharacterized membrane protein